MPSLRITLESNQPGFIVDLLKAEGTESGSSLPTGMSLHVEKKEVKYGLTGSSILLTFILSVGSSVTASIISSLITEIWKKHVTRIQIADNDVSKQTKKQIHKIVEKMLRRKSE